VDILPEGIVCRWLIKGVEHERLLKKMDKKVFYPCWIV
jgi:hypothetical protein